MGKMKKMRKTMRDLKLDYSAQLANCKEVDKHIFFKSRVDLLDHLLFEAAAISYKPKKEKKNG